MTTEPRIIPIETPDRNYNHNTDSNSNDSSVDPNRKPSYVGLSCAVSGYSSFSRYTSPSRKTSPPGQSFRVSTEPQILDFQNYSNINMRNQQPHRGQIEASPQDTTDHYYNVRKYHHNNNCLRETSPGSDTSSVGSSSGGSGSASGGSGNLVQKQIERLYGAGKMTTVRLTSPEPNHPANNTSLESSPESCEDNFGLFNNHHKSPLELKTLKVPAVFRLLRPEFREQLKSNSCQVKIPTDFNSTPKSSRIIPIKIERNGSSNTERIIPVVRDDQPFQGRKLVTPDRVVVAAEKPALPAKPLSPTRSPPSSLIRPSPTPTTPKNNDITSPALVNSLQKINGNCKKQQPVEEQEPSPADDLEVDDDDEELIEEYPCGGIRERTLLCPIQEEDTESTASGSSVSVASKKQQQVAAITPSSPAAAAPAINNVTNEESPSKEVIQEEVHDGHYFIRMIENEMFKFEEQICDFEEDLSNETNDIPEDIRDSILAAIGKAKLLMSQKLAQFRGLCDKNINSNPEEDPFVPTSEDLAGFWDMVYIQVEHIHSLFAELTTIRTNGWKKPEVKKVVKKEPVKTATKSNKKANGAASSVKSEAAKARDEARRKMLEEKKRQMKMKQQQQQQTNNKNENECIFVEF